jgi:hypothetical protein
MRTIHVTAAVFTLIFLSCCKKPATEMRLELSADKISVGEPLIAKVVNAPAGAHFTWKLPNWAMVLQYSTDSSMVKLAYTVLAKGYNNTICVLVNNGIDSVSAGGFCKEPAWENNEKYTAPASIPGNKLKSLEGDQLTLRPYFHGDSTLTFIAGTSKNYGCLNSFILYDNASDNSKIALSFNNVWLRDACEPVNLPAISTCFTKIYYNDGSYPIEINFNKKVYKGNLTVSKFQGRFEFYWPYTEGVLIEPKLISR